MGDRKRRFDDKTDVRGKIADVLKRVVGNGGAFDGVHIFTPHGDVPDDSALRMVVIPPESWYSREESQLAFDFVLECVRNNGAKPRYRGNRLIFLAADHGALSRLRDAARVVLAWTSSSMMSRKDGLNVDSPAKEAGRK